MAAASHGSGATVAPRPLEVSAPCLSHRFLGLFDRDSKLVLQVLGLHLQGSKDPGHNAAVRFSTLICVVVYTQVSGAGGRRTVSSAGFSDLQTFSVIV